MADTRKLLDYQGLALYDSKLKAMVAEEYAKKTDIKDVDLTPYVKTEDLDKRLENVSAKDEIEQAIAPLATKDELATAITDMAKKSDIPDVSNLATKDEVTTATTGLATQAEVTAGNEALNGSIADVKGNVDTLGGRVEAIENANYLTKEEGIEIALANNKEARFVNELPPIDEAVAGLIYMVPKKDGEGNETNHKDEFIFDPVENRYEPVGDTMIKVDLSNYPSKDEMNQAIGQATGSIVIETITVPEIDALFA